MDVLRFATAGSVDDGKSSLIGRLLYDTKSIYEDQYAAIERASAQRGADGVELALLTDGLRAEREQNITIDVAYRYFSTPNRKFIIADTPGHVQYTRNMVTGTSNADLSVILVDATKGVLPQSKRHSAVSALLGVPHLLFAVNKMDLVDYREDRFREIVEEFANVVRNLGVHDATFIPVSALVGDNVVDSSERMPWYVGPTLLSHLETVEIPRRGTGRPFRMAVQNVIRPNQDFRGLAGRIADGTVAEGDRVVVLPSGVETSVKSVRGVDGPVPQAGAGDPVVLEFTTDVDASRGNLIAAADAPPVAAQTVEAVVCWLGERPLRTGEPYVMLHTTRRLGARVDEILSAVDVETLQSGPAHELRANDLGRVRLRTTVPIFAERYADDRELGSFVLVDRGDNVTVAAGMIERLESTAANETRETVWVVGGTPEQRQTAADEAAARRGGEGMGVIRLDEARLNATVNADDPSPEEAVRRARAVAALLSEYGPVVATLDLGGTSRWHAGPNETFVDFDEGEPSGRI